MKLITRMTHLTLALLLAGGLTAALLGQAAKPAAAPVPVKLTVGATDAAGCIPYWIALEPLTIPAAEANGKGTDVDYLKAAGAGSEATAAPIAGDSLTYNGEKHLWKAVSSDVGSPFVDCENISGATYNAVTYLVAYIKLDKEEPKATVTWGSDDGGALYVNGKQYSSWGPGRHVALDTSIAKDVPLKKGLNTIMLKVLNGYGESYGVCRLVGSDDKPLAGVTILMAPEGKAAPKDAFWYQVDTGEKPIEGTFTEYLAKKAKK
jgi:hypothetical protein